MVSAGLGVALLARWAVKNYLAGGRIVRRPLNKSGFRRRWHAATLRKPSHDTLSDGVSEPAGADLLAGFDVELGLTEEVVALV
jgi:DNA-binding transcriptional LysR family regulator